MAARYPGRAALGGGHLVRLVDRAAVGAADPRVSVLIAIAPPVKREDYAWDRTLASDKPKFFIQGEQDELCPVKDLWAFYAQAAGAEGAGRHRRRDAPVRRQDAARSARPLEDLLGDFD